MCNENEQNEHNMGDPPEDHMRPGVSPRATNTRLLTEP
ncbi:hypothetical protein SAMN04488121_101464, partial [Chitinophaga filiformis]